MNLIKNSLAAAAIIGATATTVMADDKATVQAFYDLLSNAGSASHAEAFTAATSEDWESIGNYSGENKSKPAFIGQMEYFSKLVPDLNWEVVEMIQAENKVVVRGRASGTPVGPLFGVDGQGKGFDIMSIDIHTLEDGKIKTSYHVEDWAGALNQLKAQ
ncbi:MAG: ester cyclase [Gammaproteobacteria bacterium]|nr:ester cyclase [Gammaproteobacteria bacterium]